MPIISRGVPAFTSGPGDPAGWGNDDDYGTQWRSTELPAWLAYDLSEAPVAARGRALVAWYNGDAVAYDVERVDRRARASVPAAYAIEANTAAGGGEPPVSGWVTLAEVTGNTYHSRQHVVDLAGANWVRLVVTATHAPIEGWARLNFDVHDAGQGVADTWIFYGDSITQGSMNPVPLGQTATFGQLVNLLVPSRFPSQEGGGIGGLRSEDGAREIGAWLAAFPGRYVGLSYGTNDAKAAVSPETFYANYERMVRAVLAAGKVPVVPKVPWGRADYLQANVPALNAALDALYAAEPAIIPGPDFWTFFVERQSLISRDGVHPTAAGYAAYRQHWAVLMIERVYRRE